MNRYRGPRVLHWDDERDLGNSLIVTLVNGLAFYPHADESVAEHVKGFGSVKAAEAAVRRAKSCACARCTR